MKRVLLLLCFALFAFSAVAETPSAAPELPLDLDIAWQEIDTVSCKIDAEKTLEIRLYARQQHDNIFTGLTLYMLNGAEIAHVRATLRVWKEKVEVLDSVAHIRFSDDLWKFYHSTVEDQAKADEDILSVLGIAADEFTRCVK